MLALLLVLFCMNLVGDNVNYIYIGDIVNTHGIKGEVKIISHFKYKKNVFIKGTSLYIGDAKTKLIINSYRHHKVFDMVTFVGIDDINDVLRFKGESVYIDRNDVNDCILNEDIIDMEVYNDNSFIGHVTDILNNGVYDILVVCGKKKNLIPNINEFVKNIDVKSRRIDINVIEGLLNED